jgi:primosomal replication protein N
LRYTPAGLPALDVMLKHASEVSEDGTPRQVAIGQGIARQVAALSLGTPASFAGFLASGRNGRGLVFHITSLD